MQLMPKAGLIHLSTSATYKISDKSAKILLSPSEKDDGILTADEIINLELSAELAVLSGCDTGKGHISSDGFSGLTRSLIIAGVPSVILTLAPVDDTATGIFMNNFYQHILYEKLNKASALRKAMLTFVQSPDFNHPYYWSAFTLVGKSE
jgi:CHAT domain-containing protein